MARHPGNAAAHDASRGIYRPLFSFDLAAAAKPIKRSQRGWFPGIITYLFLHAGWLHIFFNMLFLWTAGMVLERRIGIGMAALYFAGGAAAAWSQYTWGPPTTQVLVGASGAIAALMGFALLAMPTARITLFYVYFTLSGRAGTFESPLWFCLPLWILQQIFMLLMPLQGALASIGYAAHVGGFVFGGVIGLGYRLLHHAAEGRHV
jgi:membrane associated rhomboid family serine protease